MAWLLVRTFSDEKATAWKRGDIVEVRSEKFVAEHGWGKLECLPRFYRVQVSDLEAEQVKSQLEAPDQDVDDQTGEVTRFNRVRRCNVDLDVLPTAMKTSIERDGIVALATNDITVKANNGSVIRLTAELANG